jgi:hypothetical protein
VTKSHHTATSITFLASPICVYTLPDLEATTKGIDHLPLNEKDDDEGGTDLSILMQRSDFLAYLATLFSNEKHREPLKHTIVVGYRICSTLTVRIYSVLLYPFVKFAVTSLNKSHCTTMGKAP